MIDTRQHLGKQKQNWHKDLQLYFKSRKRFKKDKPRKMLTGISGSTAKNNFKNSKNTYQSNGFGSNFFLRMKGTLQSNKSTLEHWISMNQE